jgi:hypothetical protein
LFVRHGPADPRAANENAKIILTLLYRRATFTAKSG